MGYVPKAGDGGGVNGDAVLKGPGQLGGHDGDVFLPAEYVTKGEADELDLLLLNILHDLALGIFHGHTNFHGYFCVAGHMRRPQSRLAAWWNGIRCYYSTGKNGFSSVCLLWEKILAVQTETGK